jgi:beta-N-acetylhexosaminidase
MNEARVTRRRMLTGIGCAAVAAGVAGCSGASARDASPLAPPVPPGAGGSVQSAAPGSATPRPSSGPATPSHPAAKPAAPKSAHATTPADDTALRRKIASLLVVGFRGETVRPDDWIMRAITEEGLGGVILFDRDQQTGARRNISSPSQVTALIRTLKQTRKDLIVSIDQEGGKIARLNLADGFAATKSPAQIGATNSTATTRAWAQGIARSLSSIGVNLNFAPVVDMNVNPNNPAIGQLGRSFSASADVVVANATEEIKAHRAAGVRTALKHFPGFGSATGNTDFGVVDVSKTWHSSELVPFQKLIATGMADVVMVAHLLNHQLDPSRPASLSHAVVHDLLRTKLGWSGAVVSDDMQAVAITSRYGRDTAVTLAVEAGVDMLVFANQAIYDTKVVENTVNAIANLVHSGKITQAQIDQSVARVNRIR